MLRAPSSMTCQPYYTTSLRFDIATILSGNICESFYCQRFNYLPSVCVLHWNLCKRKSKFRL